MIELSHRSKQILFLCCVPIVIGVFCALVYQFRSWYLDDAFISMRYARNVVEGKGLVFNVGEHVEGYTNFAWVMLLAMGFIAQLNVPFFARAASIFFAVLTLFGVFMYLRAKYRRNPVFLLIILLLLASNGDFAAWSNSAMETMMFTCFLFFGAITFDCRSYKPLFLSGFLLTMAMFARPEGCIPVVLFSAFTAVSSFIRTKNYRYSLLHAGSFLLPVLLLYAPYFFIRYNYYGYLFPNTFYAKVGNSILQVMRGICYTANFIFDYVFLIVPACFGYIFFFKRYFHFVLLILFYMGYVVYVGGDPFPAYRFLIPLSPFIYIGYFFFICKIYSRLKLPAVRRLLPVCIGITFVVQVMQVWYRHDFLRLYADDVTRVGRKIGMWIKEYLPSDTVIALNAVGAVPYYSRLKTIDMLGLTDEYLAHNNSKKGGGLAGHELGDGSYVLSRQPDIIVFSGPWGHELPLFKGDYDLYANPLFFEKYLFYTLPIQDIIFCCYVRKDNRYLVAVLDDFLSRL